MVKMIQSELKPLIGKVLDEIKCNNLPVFGLPAGHEYLEFESRSGPVFTGAQKYFMDE